MNNNFSEEDIKKVAKGAGTTLIGSIAGGGFNFLSQILIARVLGVEAFGLYALGFAAVRICETLARLGLNMGGMRFVSIYKDESRSKLKGVLISATGISLLNGILIGIILYFSSDFIAQKIFHKANLTEALQLFALSIPFVSSMEVASSLLLGFHTTKYTVYARNFVQPVTYIFLIIFFYFNGFRLDGVIYAFILSHVVAFIVCILFLKKLFPEFLSKYVTTDYEFKNLISYSIPLLFVGFLHYFLSWTVILMLGFLGSTKDVGIYRAASQVTILMTVFISAVGSIYAPLVSEMFYEGEKKRIESIFKVTTRWIYIIVLPVSLILVFSSKGIMSIFGAKFIEKGASVLIILTIAQFVNCVTGGVGCTLIMTGKQKLELINSLGLVIVNIVLNLLLIPQYGIMGAAIATAASVISINILRLVEVYELYQMHPYSKDYIKILVPAMISVLLILCVQLLRVQYMWNAIINILIITLSFITYLKIAGLDDEDSYILSLLKQKFSSKLRRAHV
jgi:O-antigen/teichoic acid export membrane protein